MDPFTIAAGVTAAAGVGVGFHLRRRALRAEARAARLLGELRAERHASRHDPLTGLLNRRGFYQHGSRLIGQTSRPRLAGVLFDLDGFKQINDNFGHAVGDQILVLVAQRFAQYAGDCPVARLGGDEFAGLLTGSSPPDDVLAANLSRMLSAPVLLSGRRLTVSASVGLAPVTDGVTLAEVLHRADRAMYRAKSTGCGIACFDPVRDDDSRHRPDARPALRVRDLDTDLLASVNPRTRELALGEMIL